LMLNVAPGLTVEDEVNFGPLTYMTLCGGVSLFVHSTVWPTLALTASGENARFLIETDTAGPALGALVDELAGGVLAGAELGLLELDDELDQHPANASRTRGRARSGARVMGDSLSRARRNQLAAGAA